MCFRRYVFALLLCLFAGAAHGQCLVDSIVINTGYEPTTGAAATGSSDPKWIVNSCTATIPGGASSGSPAYIIAPVTASWAANPAINPGQWISATSATGFTTYGTGTAYHFTLSRPFRMCAADSIKITLHIANDNYMPHVDVDGTTTLGFSQTSASPASNFNMFTYYTQTVYLSAGVHAVNFTVWNLDATGYNPMGMDIYGSLASATGTSSLVKENDTSCGRYVCGYTPPCDTVALADSAFVCAGNATVLNAMVSGTDSLISIYWSPAAGLSSLTIPNPVATPAVSGYYYIDVMSLILTNLVDNGSFTAGNSGFTSSYTYAAPPSSVLNEGYYSIYNNPYGVHTGFTAFGDHTTGTGNMMIVNGGSAATDIWCQTITVTPYTNYDFSAWFANCSSASGGALAPVLQFKINGSLIGSPVTVTASPGTWVNFSSSWYSGTNTTATICIYDANTTAGGNDFVVDDIAFRQYCNARDSIYVKVTPPDTSFSSQDTAICASVGSLTLAAPAGFATYLWSNGSTTPTIAVTASGNYAVVCNNNNCHVQVDTFHVDVAPYNVSTIVLDTPFCFPGSITLTAPAGFATYAWQNGSNDRQFTADAGGTYYVVSSSYCTDRVDSFHIIPTSLTVDLGPDTTVCKNYPIRVPVSGNDVSFRWQDGSTGSTYSASHTGTYSVTITQGGCTATDAVNVTFFHMEQNIPDTFICKGVPIDVPVQCTVPPGGSVLWNDGITSPARKLTDSGTWWVFISKDECKILDTVRINTGYCNCWHFVPEAFTPNNDGLNDVITPRIQPGCTISGYEFNIYNRWGERVFSTGFRDKGWDGIFNGVPADIGVYMYSLQFFIGEREQAVVTSGTIMLVR